MGIASVQWRPGLTLPGLLAILLAQLAGTAPSVGYTQPDSRWFPETGKTVTGRFLAYWSGNGGLAQQGFPISSEMQERSDTDGKTYTVQYFERAVFELHPENRPPYDVLLSLLGSFGYKAKYPGGAPNQHPNTGPGSRFFSETGKRAGGRFLDYWNKNAGALGAVAQQGFPISDEFQEKSDLDGKTYTVQYFERAVFELHPENRPPFDVLLSHLGTFRYRARYAASLRSGAPAPPSGSTPTPVASRPGWAQITAANEGPAARRDHATLYDPVRKRLVVFGGRGAKTYGDTWIFEFASHAWREVKGDGPWPRFAGGTVYDAANRRMIIVMGQGNGFFNDVWAFDLERETWRQLVENKNGADVPRTRYGQSAALDSRGRVLISHGFSDQGRFDDTWAFDLASNRWAKLTPSVGSEPLKRCLHDLAYDRSADRLVLFGGCSSGFGPCPQGDLWALDLKGNTWSELNPLGAKPSPRSNPSIIYEATANRLFLFGGDTGKGLSSEGWTYDLAANTWTQLDSSGGPSARTSQGLAYDPEGKRAILFGGQTDNGTSKELWEWRF
jgi:hypothetical protein